MLFFKKLFSVLTKRERLFIIVAAAGAAVSFVALIGIVIGQSTTAIPTAGGQYVEGIVGQPEYVNPVLASSPTDEALVKLVYQNLYDIADNITASPDLTTWTVHIKDNLHWQDGTPLTANDVVFTVQSIQNKDAGSPLYASWQNVQVSRVSALEVQFTLPAPYAFFKNNLKELYILPQHLFAAAPVSNWYLSDYNLKPVGSGPYRFISYNKDSDGFITSYTLGAWNGTSAPHPFIHRFSFKFFNDTNALVAAFNAGQIDGFGSATNQELATIDHPYNLFSWRTSGNYAVFFNTSNVIPLQYAAVRQALSAAIDRTDLVDQIFGLTGAAGAGVATSSVSAVASYGPIPPGAPYYVPPAGTVGASSTAGSGAPGASSSSSTASSSAASSTASSTAIAETPSGDAATAAAMLDSAGWTVSTSTGFRAKQIGSSVIPLSFTLTVPDIGFLTKTADYLAKAWQSIGVQVNVVTDSPSDILANVVKNRSYDALLFGETLGPSSDLYSFWDSSQRFYPGLNLAIYSNPQVDLNIETGRAATSSDHTAADFAVAQTDIENDTPAVFLYSPDYLYVAAKSVHGVTTTGILTDPADRFLQIGSWYLDTSRIFK
jgi:peptide/nickel transport system substrate-binding protein